MRAFILLIIICMVNLQARELFFDEHLHEFLCLDDNDLQNIEFETERLSHCFNKDLDKLFLLDVGLLNKIDELDGPKMFQIIKEYNLYFEIKGEHLDGVLTASDLKLFLKDQNKKINIKIDQNRPKEVGNHRFQHMFLSDSKDVYGTIYMRNKFSVRDNNFDVFIVIDNSIYSGSAILTK